MMTGELLPSEPSAAAAAAACSSNIKLFLTSSKHVLTQGLRTQRPAVTCVTRALRMRRFVCSVHWDQA